MWDDPIVAEVRLVREQLAAKFSFDVHAIFADVRNRQGTGEGRLVRRPKGRKAGRVAACKRETATLLPGR